MGLLWHNALSPDWSNHIKYLSFSFIYLSFFLSLFISIFLSISPLRYIFSYLFIFLSIYPTIFLSSPLSFYPTVFLSTPLSFLSTLLSIYPTISYLSIPLSLYFYIFLSSYLTIRMHWCLAKSQLNIKFSIAKLINMYSNAKHFLLQQMHLKP